MGDKAASQRPRVHLRVNSLFGEYDISATMRQCSASICPLRYLRLFNHSSGPE